MVIPQKFYWAEPFSESLAVIMIDGLYGFIDKTGKVVIKPDFAMAHSFNNGLASVNIGGEQIGDGLVEGGKWGYIDSKGKFMLPADYDEADDFYNGRAIVKKENMWYDIDTSGHVIKSWESEY
jgi:hypothetical protein